jgi:hypothetical protein
MNVGIDERREGDPAGGVAQRRTGQRGHIDNVARVITFADLMDAGGVAVAGGCTPAATSEAVVGWSQSLLVPVAPGDPVGVAGDRTLLSARRRVQRGGEHRRRDRQHDDRDDNDDHLRRTETKGKTRRGHEASKPAESTA